jgi:UV DNA damage endonuclease
MSIGYACINMELSYPQKYGGKERGVLPITTNRTMIRRTFDEKGLDYVSELTLQNTKDLNQIINWNVLNNYNFFRLSSGLAPWKTEYEWDDLKDIHGIRQWFHSAGTVAKTHNIRLTSHPGPYNVLVSPKDHVVDNCIKDLTIHGDEFDMMGLSRTPYNKINIHLGGAYGDKEASMKRFVKNFPRLPESVRSRLTLENDDKASMYSMVFTKRLVFLLYLITITISFVRVVCQNKKHLRWLYLLGEILNPLLTIQKVDEMNKKIKLSEYRLIQIMFMIR